MRAIRYIGPLLEVNGYGEAARHQLFALTRSAEIDVYARTSGPAGEVTPDRTDGNDPLLNWVRQRLAADVDRTPPKGAATVLHLDPVEASHRRHLAPNIIAAAWETDRLCTEWVKRCNALFDQVWVPTEWQRRVFEHSGVTTPVKVVPFVFARRWYDLPEGERLLPERSAGRPFRFLSVFQWSSRKNPGGLLRAFWHAFLDRDDVELVLKAHLTYALGVPASASALVQQERMRIAAGPHELPPVRVLEERLDRDVLLRLYRECDCYVSLSRSEGWGVPIHEALAMKRPAITTDGTAPGEVFVGLDQVTAIEGHWAPVWGMGRAQYDIGQRWIEPNMEEAVAALQAAASRPAITWSNDDHLFDVHRAAQAARDALETL